MKKCIFALLLLFTTSALATSNVNFISCYYDHMEDGWWLSRILSSEVAYDLAVNESRILNGAWTSEKPKGPEYAVCNMATGTSTDDVIMMTSYKFEAKEFKPFNGNSCEEFDGTDIKLISKENIELNRGDHSEMLSDWLPPQPDKFSIRTYFPKPEEIDQIRQISERKCLELMPKD